MKYCKFLLLVVVICIKTFPTNGENGFKANIVIVDLQSILEHSLAMQSIRKSIDLISQNIQSDIAKKELQLKKIEEALIKKRSTLKEEVFDKEVNEFNKKVSQAQKYIHGRKIQLDQAHAEAFTTLYNATVGIISAIAKKNNISIVLQSSQVLFVNDDLNITPEVIRQLNSKIPHIKVNYQ